MVQTIIVALIFIAAVAYIGRLVYRHFQADTSCATGCGKCGAIDFNKLEKQIKQKGI